MSKTKLVIVYSPGQARHRAVIRPTWDDPDDWDDVRINLHTTPLHRAVAANGKHVHIHKVVNEHGQRIPSGKLMLLPPGQDSPRHHDLATGNVLPGEGVLIISIREYDTLAADLRADGQCPSQGPDILVSQHLQKSMKSDRCVIVDEQGIVIAETRGDPAICWHPDGALVLHETAKVGDRLVCQQLIPLLHQTSGAMS